MNFAEEKLYKRHSLAFLSRKYSVVVQFSENIKCAEGNFPALKYSVFIVCIVCIVYILLMACIEYIYFTVCIVCILLAVCIEYILFAVCMEHNVLLLVQCSATRRRGLFCLVGLFVAPY